MGLQNRDAEVDPAMARHYIAEMLDELAAIARKSDLTDLETMLRMARTACPPAKGGRSEAGKA